MTPTESAQDTKAPTQLPETLPAGTRCVGLAEGIVANGSPRLEEGWYCGGWPDGISAVSTHNIDWSSVPQVAQPRSRADVLRQHREAAAPCDCAECFPKRRPVIKPPCPHCAGSGVASEQPGSGDTETRER